jgi:hypothetical protein
MMRWMGILFIMGISHLYSQQPGCSFWFSLSHKDPSPVVDLHLEEGDTLILHAWISVYQPEWRRVDGVIFPIWFNTEYLEFLEAALDTPLFWDYWFRGVNCPSGCGYGNPYSDQILWYAVVCVYSTNCLNPDRTPYHVGWFKFYVRQGLNSPSVLVDTMTYPPENSPMVNDETGTRKCYPCWYPITGYPQVVSEKNMAPEPFLIGIKPNPFNKRTTLRLEIFEGNYVEAKIYDVDGRLVKNLFSEFKERGRYEIEWDGKDDRGTPLPSGVYLLILKGGRFAMIKHLLMIR